MVHWYIISLVHFYMRNSCLIFVISLLFIVLTDTVLWLQIRQYIRRKWITWLYILHSLLFAVVLVAFQYLITRLSGGESYFWIGKMIGILFLVYAPKFIFIVINGISLLCRRLSNSFSNGIRYFALGISGCLFLFLLYGITLGRYHYKIETVPVTLVNLPPSFDGFKIVQLTDLHLGSYGKSYRGIPRLVEEVNQLHPDLIVFTGDMVNNFADEISPWIETLKGLRATYGKYAVTGNHDYGDYTHWPSPEAKHENMNRFYENMKEIGFHMLNNIQVPIVLQEDTIWLAGVENWGKPPFPRYGNLNAVIDSISGNHITLLLSHDPSHWRAEVLNHPIALTLSGHTHAMQMGIKIGQKEWSPAQYLYPEYDGLYQENEHYLYVSRGQGYLGFPGRIGLRPVITELILNSVSH